MFITLEGMDGSGKTTVVQKLKHDLEQQGHRVVLTREPGGLEICDKIREILLQNNQYNMEPWTEALLFIAARKEHLEKLIKPELEKGSIVISDRFLDSTTAYQGFARGLGVEKIQKMQDIILEGFLPDLTLYFSLSFEEAEKRIFGRKDTKNRLDQETKEFKQKVRQGFNFIAKNNPKRVKIINALLSEQEVYQQVKAAIEDKLAQWKKNN